MNKYMTNMWIDGIQNAKKSFVDTWVKDEAMAAPLHDFIKAQTEFTKIAFEAADKFANVAGEAIAKAVK
jgi:hypothetical protein